MVVQKAATNHYIGRSAIHHQNSEKRDWN